MTENEPIAPKRVDLERLSEDELEARIISLEADIQACKDELERKRAHRTAANALFGGDELGRD